MAAKTVLRRRHCYERCPDHPGLVLVADGKRRQHRNENLAAPDAREAQLCGVMGAAHHAWCTGNDTVGHGADHHCDEHSPGEEPVVGLRRAQLGPLSVERPPHVSPLSPLAYGRALNCRTSFRMVFRSCVPHASLLRRRTQARIDATAAYRANTPRPAQGDSGKQPFRRVAGQLLVVRNAALDAQRSRGSVLLDPLRSAFGQREHEDYGKHHQHEGSTYRGGATTGDRPDSDSQRRGEGEKGTRSEDDPQSHGAHEAGSGQPPWRRVGVSSQDVLCDRDGDRRGD